MTSLASLEAFAEHRGVEVDFTDVAAIRALEVTSSFLRMQTGQHLDVVTGDVQELTGDWTNVLWLPQVPVHVDDEEAETLVSLRCAGETAYTELAPTAYSVTRDGQLLKFSGYWGGLKARVRVTYDHGYEEGHERLGDIENLVCSLAARAMSATQAMMAVPAGVASETLGAYAVTYVTYADVASVGLSGTEAALIEALKNPHG